MATLNPEIQIFDFVPKIQIWGVNPNQIELFWFPLASTVAKQYNVYFCQTYTGVYTLLKTVPNSPRHAGPPYTANVIYVPISKAELGAGDVLYFFKVTSISPAGVETILADVPAKPVFSIDENRLKGRAYNRSGSTVFSWQDTIVAGTDYPDNVYDLLYVLGRHCTTLFIQVKDSDIDIKLNTINGRMITIKANEQYELRKDDLDVTKLFIRNTTLLDATIQIQVGG